MKSIYLIIFISLFCLIGCAGDRPNDLGVHNNALNSCPSSPNCVSSSSSNKAHYIEPLKTNLPELKKILAHYERAQIVIETNTYIYVEFKSFIMGFVDDVEFYQSSDNNIVEVRSASRVGYSDLGVNRKRIEHIRNLLKTTIQSKI